jgi:hypothetical protein
MADNAYVASGTTLTWDGEVVAQIYNVSGFSSTLNKKDTTTHQSAGGRTTSKPGEITDADLALSGYFDPTDTAGQLAMLTDYNAKSTKAYIVTYPSATGTTLSGNGYLSAINVGEANRDGVIPFSAAITPTDTPTFAVATVTGMSACGFSNDVLIMPAFAIGTYDTDDPYAVTITHGETSTIITPVDATEGEVITITGPDGTSQVVATGVASSAITIASDELNTITITISKTNYAPKVYVFHCAVLAA